MCSYICRIWGCSHCVYMYVFIYIHIYAVFGAAGDGKFHESASACGRRAQDNDLEVSQ